MIISFCILIIEKTKMKKYLLVGIIIVSALIINSCDEGNEVSYARNAKLIWTGDYEVDGCGFFVEIDSIKYKPENEEIIPPDFKSYDTLTVTLQYLDLHHEIETYCFSPTPIMEKAIEIISIDLHE